MNYFFALPLGNLARRINKDLLKPLQSVDAEGQLRWSAEENLHITLAYLGPLTGLAVQGGMRAKAMQEAKVQSAINAAEQIRFSAFKCNIENLAFFPDANSRVLALHLRPCAALLELQNKLRTGLLGAGLSCDGGVYKPHITLARLKHRQHISAWQLPQYSASFLSRKFALYSSDPARPKAEPKLYQKIAEFSL